MANFTPNYNLRKPVGTEQFDIDRDFNANWDVIDGELKEQETIIANLEIDELTREANETALKAALAEIEQRVDVDIPAQLNDMTQDFNALLADIDQHMLDYATQSNIIGTTQIITFNDDGTVQKVEHKDSLNAIVRTDNFTYGVNLITEIRTLTTGGTLTLIYHLDTLETEVI